MTTDINVENEILRAKLDGRLDSVTASDFEKAINAQLTKEVKTIILDFDKVDFISSKGLRVLVSLYKALPDGDLRLNKANHMVKEVLKLAGLLNVFKVETK